MSGNRLLVGQAVGGFGLEGLLAEQVHAVGGARPRHNHQPRHLAGSVHARALRRDEVVGLIRRLELDLVGKYVGKLREQTGDLAQPLLPSRAVDDQCGRGRQQVRLRLLRAEVRRGVLLLGAHLLLGLYLQIAVQRARIAAIGGVPQRARDGVAVVVQRKGKRGQRAVAVVAVRVVFRRAAQPHLHIHRTHAALVGAGDRAVLRRNAHRRRIVHRIADEVGLGLLRGSGPIGPQRRHRPLQLRAQRVDQHRLVRDRLRRRNRAWRRNVGRRPRRALCIQRPCGKQRRHGRSGQNHNSVDPASVRSALCH